MSAVDRTPPNMDGWRAVVKVVRESGEEPVYHFDSREQMEMWVQGFMAGRKMGKDTTTLELWEDPPPPAPVLRRVVESELRK